MKEQLSENLKLLDKKYPGFARLVDENKDKLLAEENLTVIEETAVSGERILKICRNGRKLYLGGKRAPRLPVKNQMNMLGKIEYTAPIFVVGLGNILYIEELLKISKTDTMILIYEPSFSIFYEQLKNIDFSNFFEKGIIALVVGGINDEKETLRALFSGMLRGDRVPIMKSFIIPNYEEICPEQVHGFMKELTEMAKNYAVNEGTRKLFSKVAADNIMHNAKYVRTGYKAGQLPEVLPRDIPAIVVAAGPSLNKNIKQLKKAKNKAFIIAVDTAIKPLLKEGIVPDMYATIDGRKPLELVTVEESREIPLIANIDSSKLLLDYHKGKKFFYFENWNYIDEIYEMNNQTFQSLPTGGSVATLAFSLVCHIGFKTVIMVGQDLAYTGNKSHADGTFNDVMKEEDTSKYKMVPGNYEEMVPTLANLNGYRVWFENFIEGWKEKFDLRVINATEGGAYIKGTELMTLEEAIESECGKEVDIAACFDKLEPVFNEEEQQKILKYFHDTPNEYQKIIIQAREGKNLYKKLHKMCRNGNVDKNGYLKLLNKIKKNTKKIEKNVNYQLIMTTLVNADQILRTAQYREYQSIEEEGEEIGKKGELFMELIEECAGILKGLAEETVAKLQ